jgi:hypothetical protein
MAKDYQFLDGLLSIDLVEDDMEEDLQPLDVGSRLLFTYFVGILSAIGHLQFFTVFYLLSTCFSLLYLAMYFNLLRTHSKIHLECLK